MATQKHPNIPTAPFSEDVNDIKFAESPATVIQKYRFMEINLQNKRARLESLLAELETSLRAVHSLDHPTPLPYDFELGDTLYAHATIPAGTKLVGLWLGAGVMLEYNLPDASSFLTTKLSDRKQEIAKIDSDLEFIRRQITTMEVNMARLLRAQQ